MAGQTPIGRASAAKVYARNFWFDIGQSASFVEKDSYPSAIECLLGAIAGSLSPASPVPAVPYKDLMGSGREVLSGAIQERVAADRGTRILPLDQFFLRNLAFLQSPHTFDDESGVGFAAVYPGTPHHGAAVDQNGGQIQSGCRHGHAGDDFIAGSLQRQSVVLVCLHHQFDTMGDDVAGGQDIAHAFMALGNAVAGPDDPEFHRCAAGRTDTFTDRRGHLALVFSRENGFDSDSASA